MDYPTLLKKIRDNQFRQPTTGYAMDQVQANVVILPQKYAYDFLVFCVRNPKPCPLLGISDPGSPYVQVGASSKVDIRTDVPMYRIYDDGSLIKTEWDIKQYWQDDFVTFLLGCSFTFEGAILKNGIDVKHISEGKNVSMYKTDIDCSPSGMFSGKMVVSMRPFHYSDVPRVVEVTSRFPQVHGSPVHIGDPGQIGIKKVDRPDFGDPIEIDHDEVPVFWACGVTPQVVALNGKPDLMITHAPGHMLITDCLNAHLSL